MKKLLFLSAIFVVSDFLGSFGSNRLWGQNLNVAGFVSHGYLDSSHYNYLADTDDGTMNFAEMGVNVAWTVRERTIINGQLFAFELGPYGNFDPLIDYLFLDYNFDKEFGIRIGRIKRELGVYTHIQDIDVARTSILLPIGIYDQRYRDFSASLDGVSFYGSVGLVGGISVDYNVWGGLVDLQNDGGIAGYTLTLLSRIADDGRIEAVDSKYNLGSQVWLYPNIEGLRFGFGVSEILNIEAEASAVVPSTSENPFLIGLPFNLDIDEINLRTTHFSAEYYIGQWNFVGEYVRSRTDSTIITQIGSFPGSVSSSISKGDAWYASVSRRLGQFEVGLTYTEYYEHSDNRDGRNMPVPHQAYNKDAQFSVRYDVSDYWSVKAEVHEIKGTNRLFNEFNQNPLLDEEDWSIFALKSTFTF